MRDTFGRDAIPVSRLKSKPEVTNMKIHLVAAFAAIAIVSQASAPVFAAQGGNQAASGLATPEKHSRAKVNCNSAPSCNQLISKCTEKDGNWNPENYNKQGEVVKGNCTGL